MNPGDVLLLGALELEMDRSGEVVGARNAVMTVHADGRLGPRYDKAHLVPFGEYLPMRPLLSAIGLSRLAPGDIDFWPGPGPRTIDLGAFGKAGRSEEHTSELPSLMRISDDGFGLKKQ